MLVVAAPADSEPTTPLTESHSDAYVQPWVEDLEESEGNAPQQPVEGAGPVGQTESSSPSLVTVAEAGQPVDVAGNPASVDDDEDFSAWMDNPGPQEPDLPAKTQEA
jgi:hypothetical protein